MTRAALTVLLLGSAAASVADDALTDEAFFEFLGSFEDEDGQWLDPLELDRAAQAADRGAARQRDDDDDDEESVDEN